MRGGGGSACHVVPPRNDDDDDDGGDPTTVAALGEKLGRGAVNRVSPPPGQPSNRDQSSKLLRGKQRGREGESD